MSLNILITLILSSIIIIQCPCIWTGLAQLPVLLGNPSSLDDHLGVKPGLSIHLKTMLVHGAKGLGLQVSGQITHHASIVWIWIWIWLPNNHITNVIIDNKTTCIVASRCCIVASRPYIGWTPSSGG